jgi:isopenicillin N synthase-like dioxygenase
MGDGLHVVAADALEHPSEQTIATIADAARRHATLYLARHGAGGEIARAMDVTREFFALPLEERMNIAARGAQDFGYRGADRSAQVLTLTRTPEPHPLFGSIRWPARPAGFQPVIEDFLDRMYRVAIRVLSAIARSLDLEPDYFDSKFGHGAIENLQLRLYDAQAPYNPLPLAAHSDPPPITLIVQDDVGGLDSLSEGSWIPVSPIEGTLVCQFGTMMARWTDDRYPANVHRVRCAEGTSRYSIVYNLLPRRDAVIERLPSCRSSSASSYVEPLTLDAFLGANLPMQAVPARAESERTIDAHTLAGCRLVVRRGSAGRWSLDRASRSDATVTMRLRAGDQPIDLEISRVQQGRRSYRSVGGFGFSYRDHICDPSLFTTLDRLIPAFAVLFASSFDG